MQITIALFDDRVVTVDIDAAADLDTLKAILEAETTVPATQQMIIHNGTPLAPGSALSAQGVAAGDLLMMEKAAPGAGSAPRAGNPLSNMSPEQLAAKPEIQALLQQLRSAPQDRLPPPLRQALASNDIPTVVRLVDQFARQLGASGGGGGDDDPFAAEEARLRSLAAADPFNVDVQRQLEDLIQKRNVHENYINALEHNPEAFGSVTMLFVPAAVNGVSLPAFVDSGAQMTIMSRECAERCNLLRLMDTRFAGMAVGVGSGKILGRIHMAPLAIGGKHLPISITVLERGDLKFIFGLDNLRRHQVCIDLQANCLRFPGLDLAVPFLAEHEIPKDTLFSEQERAKKLEEEAGKEAAAKADGGASGSGSGSGAAAAAAPPAPAPAAGGGGGAALPTGWEEKVQRLMALGFPRDQCEGALRATEGNEEMAGSMLFGGF